MSNDVLLQQATSTEVTVDQSKVTAGGPRLPAEGKCPARLIGYIELGKHPQGDYQGAAKKPELEARLVFECLGKKNEDAIDIDGETIVRGRIIKPFDMTIKLNARAKFHKWFKDMDYDRGNTHMSHMLNEVFLLDIKHGKSKAGNDFANIKSISKPLVEIVDPETGEVTDEVDLTEKTRPASYDLQLFLQENPTFEQWDSLYVEGTYTKKTKNEDGVEVEEEISRNSIQEKIKDSLDWEGSAMQVLLASRVEEVVEEAAKAEDTPPAKKAPAKKPAAKKETPVDTPEAVEPVAATETPVDTADAMLEELGIA